MTLAFLFPGQGSQQPGMLHTLPESPAVSIVLDELHAQAADIELLQNLDTATALANTANAQIALLVAGVACARALIDDGGLNPQFVAGHSVGAYAAAVIAGVLTLPEALTAVEMRGRLMEEVCSQGDWGMAAMTGLPTRTAAQLAEKVSTEDDPVWLANINSATQTVVSGTAAGMRRAARAAETAGALTFELLDISVASHCPLQSGTAATLAKHLAQLPRRIPTARYLTNTGGRAVITADAILDDLALAVAQPVLWYDATRLMAELGVTCAIQTPPGQVLARLLGLAAPTVTSLSIGGGGSIMATAARAKQVARKDSS